MADRSGSPDNDKTEFERIVTRLQASGFRSAGRKARSDTAGVPGQRMSNGMFCLGCLAVIFPMSMVVGGWLGILTLIVALVVTVRLVAEEAV